MTTNLTTTFSLVNDGTTDNHTQYVAIRTFYAGVTQPPYLDLLLDTGSYHCTAYPSFIDDGTTPGITRATIACSGATMLQAWLGGNGSWEDNLHSARVNSVPIGTESVTLSTPSQISVFAGA